MILEGGVSASDFPPEKGGFQTYRQPICLPPASDALSALPAQAS